MIFQGQTILTTVSWLSCWKELRCLNLDFSHGLTQANVLSTQHAWQQALQLSPAVKCPQTLLKAPVTGNQADVAPPTSTSPAHPLHRWSLLPSPATTPETKLQKLLLPAPAQSPERLSPTTEARHPSTGDWLPTLIPTLPPAIPTTTTALPYPTPHSQGKKSLLA